ncbi:potassium channel family protein [Gryllotalpicola reticulitermitis]|uniref:Potassium channel family protein n=1 Tax=Gryllotalpicola reticulitermitis TaxID=1184153 RepID=A0ABV8QBY9_9MICO
MTQATWRRWTDWPLAGLAVLFLVAYSWEVIGQLHGAAERVSETIEWVSWSAFAIDYVVSLVLAQPRWRWFYTHLIDLAIVALPVLRPLRLLRVAAAFTVLQRRTGTALRGRVIAYAIGAGLLLIYVSALAELNAEQARGHIKTIWQALWWSVVTITTTGYGDYTPVTATGKLIAVCVMFGGVALIGVVSATLASWIVERVVEDDEAETQVVTALELQELRDEIRALRLELERRSTDESG